VGSRVPREAAGNDQSLKILGMQQSGASPAKRALCMSAALAQAASLPAKGGEAAPLPVERGSPIKKRSTSALQLLLDPQSLPETNIPNARRFYLFAAVHGSRSRVQELLQVKACL